jgi:molybdopterin-guanine dinucleotide biosynthesis protein A
VNCYILVGGQSKRMGRPKPELFLDHVAREASQAFDDVIAVQRNGEPAVAITTIFERRHDAQAPVFGVERALDHAGTECFVLAVDYPLITAAILRNLRACFESAPHALLLAPVWSGKTQMLCAGYGFELLPRIRQRIAAERYDLRGLADAQEAVIIPEQELRAQFSGEPLMNANTPEDLKRIE